MADAVETHGFEPKVIYTHTDLDGVVCGMIARHRFPGVPIVPLNYDELDQVREIPCLVMDLNLPADHPLVRSDGVTPLTAPVWIMDHHRATWYPSWFAETALESAFRQYDFGDAIVRTGIRLYHHPGRCAAAIALEVLFPDCILGAPDDSACLALLEWTLLANAADLWLENDKRFPLSRALTAVVRQSGFEFALEEWDDLPPDAPSVQAMAASAEAADKRTNSEAVRAAIASMAEEDDHLLGLCVAGSISHVAHGVLEYRRAYGLEEKPVALVILQSLLNDSDRVAVGVRGPGALEVARRYGGGGHPESAGFELPRIGIVDSVVRNARQALEVQGPGPAGATPPSAAKDPGPPARGAFAGLEVGSRLILIRDARDFAKAGDEVEVVAMLQPGDSQGAIRVPNDGIRVRRVDGSDREVEFMWNCGRRYFARDGQAEENGE